jgi:hypothetical protein
MPARILTVVFCALALAAPAAAVPRLLVGATEDAALQIDPLAAKAKMDLARLAGFNAIRLSAVWSKDRRAPGDHELLALENAVAAADLNGIRIILSVWQTSRNTPLTPAERADFVAYTSAIARELPTVEDYIIGNEPNLNLFWWPQFGPNGENAAATAYTRLLAESYDALKAINSNINVIGGSVSPRGGDNPHAARKTHSPTTFIPDMGAAYRASGRTKPLMDSFAFHPYGDNSSQPPEFRHPRSTTIGLGDYDKLVALLGKAFDGTAQLGSGLPVIYDEYGVDSTLAGHAKSSLYTGREPATTKPVAERTQADYYRRALVLATCQPTVIGLMFFHVTDEPDLDRWQSGVYYADDTPKTSLAPVRAAALAARNGNLTRCQASPRDDTGLGNDAGKSKGTGKGKPKRPK